MTSDGTAILVSLLTAVTASLGLALYHITYAEQPYVTDTCSTVFSPDDDWLQRRLRYPKGHGSGSLSWDDAGGRRAYEEGIPDDLPIPDPEEARRQKLEPRKVRIQLIAPQSAPGL